MTMQTCVVLFLGLAFGLLWLGYLIGWDKAIFKLGAQPFLLAELLKILPLVFLFPFIKKLRRII